MTIGRAFTQIFPEPRKSFRFVRHVLVIASSVTLSDGYRGGHDWLAMSVSLAGDTEEDQRLFFDGLCAKHLAALQAAARQVCRDAVTANDLVQDTLERAWKNLGALQDEDRARAWLVRIMRNAWLDQVRRRRHEVPLDQVEEPPSTVADEPRGWEHLTLEDVRRAIESLDEPFRTVAILHDVDGCSYEEIAKRLRIPYATAATRLHRARRLIRAALQQALGEEV
jgi:RNA polymerase sigma-70 factor, ECF subfamily